MRLPASASFPPPPPANDRTGLVHWPADLLAHAPARRRYAPSASLLDHLPLLALLALVLWATGFRF
ncbi:hypothetical protein EBE87_03965 [Pseudoroseomonas wenyumeiae]|uniref:Uncharacterized protein n=1 Tax=Teichococcus wenyumeiae TaxID=2478470 RepID=A0A3A9JCA3_9PROT|nr:hypothetical protein [Pseudoroseomonas wenyumeiae]RKK01044.1 hypothetical protein D6Z83_27105 [Pseudoroseomonas wenyumeiae]RMI26442.1 hypothetical protein EBE87_03965 [Pseudoroseomonas wenyumeiae]